MGLGHTGRAAGGATGWGGAERQHATAAGACTRCRRDVGPVPGPRAAGGPAAAPATAIAATSPHLRPAAAAAAAVLLCGSRITPARALPCTASPAFPPPAIFPGHTATPARTQPASADPSCQPRFPPPPLLQPSSETRSTTIHVCAVLARASWAPPSAPISGLCLTGRQPHSALPVAFIPNGLPVIMSTVWAEHCALCHACAGLGSMANIVVRVCSPGHCSERIQGRLFERLNPGRQMRRDRAHACHANGMEACSWAARFSSATRTRLLAAHWVHSLFIHVGSSHLHHPTVVLSDWVYISHITIHDSRARQSGLQQAPLLPKPAPLYEW